MAGSRHLHRRVGQHAASGLLVSHGTGAGEAAHKLARHLLHGYSRGDGPFISRSGKSSGVTAAGGLFRIDGLSSRVAHRCGQEVQDPRGMFSVTD